MKKTADRYNLIGIDIGSSKINASVIQIDSGGKMVLKGTGSSVSQGLIKNKIVDPSQLVRAIKRCVSRAERNSGVLTKVAIVNVSGKGIYSVINKGVVSSNQASGQISLEDKQEVLKRSKTVKEENGHKIIHCIPLYFKVDEKKIFTDPVGIFGTHLEVATSIIIGERENILKLTNCLKNAGLKVGGLVLGILATGEVMLSKEEKEDGVTLIDIGGSLTEIGLYQNGVLRHVRIVPLGGDFVTRDIAAILKVSIPEAERLKVVSGYVQADGSMKKERIDVLAKDKRYTITMYDLCQIIEARMSEILNVTKKELEKVSTGEDNYKKIVLCGGGSFLKGCSDYVFKTFNRPVREGIPERMKNIVNDIMHVTSTGLIIYALEHNLIKFLEEEKQKEDIKSKLRNWIKDFF